MSLRYCFDFLSKGFFKEVIFFYCFDGKYETAISKRVAFRLLALADFDHSKAEIIIAYSVCNLMEETSSVIICRVNIGNLINTRREVLEACIIEAVPIVFVIRDS